MPDSLARIINITTDFFIYFLENEKKSYFWLWKKRDKKNTPKTQSSLTMKMKTPKKEENILQSKLNKNENKN